MPLNIFICFFDQPLQPGPVSAANWSLRAAGRERILNAPIAGGSVVTTGTTFAAFVGGNRVSYSAAIPDVRGLTGTPADPFVAFPVDVV